MTSTIEPPKLLILLVAIATAGVLTGARASAQRSIPGDAARLGTAASRLAHERTDAFIEAARRGSRYLPGQVLVKFRAGMSTARRQRALSALRSRPTAGDVRWIGTDVAVVQDPDEPDAASSARRLADQPEVEYAQPNYIRRRPGIASGNYRPLSINATAPTRLPQDPDYQDLQWNMSLINMPGAWAINPGGNSSVTVAVIDTGVTTAATTLTMPLWTGQRFETVAIPFSATPDLSAARLVGALDFIFFDASGGPVLDMVGHGTHVASTIAEEANNQALIGIAYHVRIMPLKVCVGYWELMLDRASRGIPGFLPDDAGGCPDDVIAEAIRYAADHGARVINLSLGGPEPSPIQRDALAYAVQHGVFVAISMGNSFLEGNPTQYPAAYAADLAGVMSVGAVGKSQTRAYYSNTGTTEIAAPGGNDLDGGGEDRGFVWQVTLYPPDQDPGLLVKPRFDRYVEVGYEGTSMAAPHVAGIAALMMTQGDLRDPKAIEAFIKSTAKDLGAPGLDNEYGYGLIQARTAIFGLGIR